MRLSPLPCQPFVRHFSRFGQSALPRSPEEWRSIQALSRMNSRITTYKKDSCKGKNAVLPDWRKAISQAIGQAELPTCLTAILPDFGHSGIVRFDQVFIEKTILTFVLEFPEVGSKSGDKYGGFRDALAIGFFHLIRQVL